MEIKSLLIKDTTREERIRIVQQGLSQCGGACNFCNGCDNLGGGSVDSFYEPYINGEKELRQLNEEYSSNSGMVRTKKNSPAILTGIFQLLLRKPDIFSTQYTYRYGVPDKAV
jgi:hypothetical protein